VVEFVLSLITVAGWKPNQTKIKMHDSKTGTAVIYMFGSSCQNNKYQNRTDVISDNSNSKMV